MLSTTLSLIAFFALIAWRFVFTSLRRRPLGSGIAAPQPQHNTFLRLVLNLERAGMPVITRDRLENGPAGGGAFHPKTNARNQPAPVAALTRPQPTGDG